MVGAEEGRAEATEEGLHCHAQDLTWVLPGSGKQRTPPAQGSKASCAGGGGPACCGQDEQERREGSVRRLLPWPRKRERGTE